MVSHRKRKKEAKQQGLNVPELEMLELLEEVLDKFRWLQVLVHAQSFLLRDRVKISDEELDKVLAAATQTVEKDARWQRWTEGLARLKGELVESRRAIRREKKIMGREARRGTQSAESAQASGSGERKPGESHGGDSAQPTKREEAAGEGSA